MNNKKILGFLPAVFLSLLIFSCSKPGDPKVNRAMEAYQHKNYEKSLEIFGEVLENKRSGIEETSYSEEILRTFIANIHMAQGNFSEANEQLEIVMEKNPDYRLLVQMGRNYKEIGDLDGARRAYQRALSLNPKKGEALAELGILDIMEGKFKDAAEKLKAAAAAEPKIAVIHADLAVALALCGDREAAEEEFQIALKLKCEDLDEFRKRAGM